MDTKTDHPFQPGVRVAITDGWDKWREGYINKVYKTGRFTLIGSDQQWRPSSPGVYDHGRWSARETGGWSRTYLRLWDATTNAEIKDIFDKQARRIRHRKLIGRLEHLKEGEITDAMLDQIEAALPQPALTLDTVK